MNGKEIESSSKASRLKSSQNLYQFGWLIKTEPVVLCEVLGSVMWSLVKQSVT
jgi:hypothetical protein